MNDMTYEPPVRVQPSEYIWNKYSPRIGEVLHDRKVHSLIAERYANGYTISYFIVECLKCHNLTKIPAGKLDNYLTTKECLCSYNTNRGPRSAYRYDSEKLIGTVIGTKRIDSIGMYKSGHKFARCTCIKCGAAYTVSLYQLTNYPSKCKHCRSGPN